jgi:DGQHR domain-containing protein
VASLRALPFAIFDPKWRRLEWLMATISTKSTDEFSVSLRRPKGYSVQAVGVIQAAALVDRYVIPHRDSRRKVGYQRPTSQPRVNKLIADLRRGQVDLPTAVLLNQRDFEPQTHLVERSDGGALLTPSGSDLYVVDGQHRIEALAKLVEESPEVWSPYEVTFVCMLGADEHEEMKQFYVVNSTAKSVRTDLALDLLKQQAENDPAFMEALIQKGEDWKVEAQTITDALEKTRLWKGRIRLPSESKGETTIGSAGMVSSLKQVLDTPFFGAISTENRVKILTAFWEGIASVIPEAFGLSTGGPADPVEYAIQKSTGVMIMHQLLIPTLELLRSQGKSVVESENYAEVLRETLLSLEGDTGEGGVARGADFWLSGVEGAAGSFSSNAGRRVLAARLRSSLPDVEVE